MGDGQPALELTRERAYFGTEHDRCQVVVSVEQRGTGMRLGDQSARQDRNDRCDTATRRDRCDVSTLGPRGRQRETPRWGHYLEFVALGQQAVRVGRELSSRYLFHRDA